MSEIKEIKATITGKVQMVMFRDFVQRKARGLGLSGTVGNGIDGAVHIVAQGQEDELERLIEHLYKGPFLAKVARVSVEWVEPNSTFVNFKLIHPSSRS